MQKSPVAYMISTLVMSTTLGTVISVILVILWQGFLSPRLQQATVIQPVDTSVHTKVMPN